MSVWHTILETAAQSPSPHNVQPWRVEILDDHSAKLFIDSTRTLPKEDTTGSFIILTMGMFLEAISILSSQIGFQLDYELFHEPDWYAPAILNCPANAFTVRKTNFVSGEKQRGNYLSTRIIFKRRTSRLSLSPDLVPENVLSNLKNLAAKWNQKFELTTDKTQIERLLKLNTEAMFADMNSKDYHNEIVEWFRFSDRESSAKLDGLDYRCMNASRLMFWTAARFSWLMKTPIISQILSKTYRAQLGAISTIAFLAGDFWKPADAIKTGRFLMRFWLETTRYNLYMHPYGNLVTNPFAAEAVKAEIKMSDIWLVFKIGYSPEPPKSHRLPLAKILVN